MVGPEWQEVILQCKEQNMTTALPCRIVESNDKFAHGYVHALTNTSSRPALARETNIVCREPHKTYQDISRRLPWRNLRILTHWFWLWRLLFGLRVLWIQQYLLRRGLLV